VNDQFDLLWRLAELDSPTPDEGGFCDYLVRTLTDVIPNLSLTRIGDSLIAWRGKPRTALFAHIDTTGFTLGYDRVLIPLGSPAAIPGDRLREVGRCGEGNVVEKSNSRLPKLGGPDIGQPGSRWVYDRELSLDDGTISGPYLDNRAGVWASIQALSVCSDVAVAFTVGEEHSGRGANVCGQFVVGELGITQSLISDITWASKHVQCGKGPAVSLRDQYAPRQRYLDKVLELAEASGLGFQREIESKGGSDGSYIQESGIPLDWVFVGAPEENAHSSNEKLAASDLSQMAELLIFIVQNLE
jgi:putative aminopeptidase FrvX